MLVQNALLHKESWSRLGYSCLGNTEHLLGSCQGRTAIVCGNARGVFEEYDEVRQPGFLIFAVNDVGCYLAHVDHWVSLHTPRLDHWIEVRRDPTSRPMGNLDFHVHDAGLYGLRTWYQWTGLTPLMALSGMFAAQVAYLMGCERIVLCGCPNDATPRFFELTCTNHAYVETQKQIKQEMAYKPEFKATIRSMSGFTRDYFGSP